MHIRIYEYVKFEKYTAKISRMIIDLDDNPFYFLSQPAGSPTVGKKGPYEMNLHRLMQIITKRHVKDSKGT